MTLAYPISASQTDAKSPVDGQLMDDIRLNLGAIKAAAELAGASDYLFKINGLLPALPVGRSRLRLDGVVISKDVTFQKGQVYLEEPGLGGTVRVDVRRATKPDTKITAISRQFSSAINSIARAGSGNSTQSITRATAQISTQSITLWKSALNISSIVPLGNNLYRYNLASTVDTDWVVGDSVTAASCSNAANDGTFTIVRAREDGGNNIVVSNVSGVAQSGSAGTLTLEAWSYNFTNPVSSQFAAGEQATFASHSAGGNNGALTIYAINQSGNNIIVKNSSGEAQGSAAGTVDVLRWIFAFSSAASATDYVVGETALTASHSTGGNNAAALPIRAVNSGGNNVILYNPSGAVQGGAAGTVNTNRWVYFFSSDPSADVSAGHSVIVTSATSAGNNGEFVVKEVNRSTSGNLVVFNASGVAQGGAAGTLVSKRALVSFASDQSATITTDSQITLYGTAALANGGTFDVLQVNRGGGANYNAVIETTGAAQVGAAGRVVFETKSLFDTKPEIVIPPSTAGFAATHGRVADGVLNSTRKTVTAGTLIFADILSIPSGAPRNLVVRLL